MKSLLACGLCLFVFGCNTLSVGFQSPEATVYRFPDTEQEMTAPFTRDYKMFVTDAGQVERFQIVTADGKTLWGVIRVVNERNIYTNLVDLNLKSITQKDLEEVAAGDTVKHYTVEAPGGGIVVDVVIGSKQPSVLSMRQ